MDEQEDIQGDYGSENEAASNEEDDRESEYEAQHEYKVSERVGGAVRKFGGKTESFRTRIDGLLMLINDNKLFSRAEIMNAIDNTYLVEFKNPVAYLLGYVASNRGHEITQDGLKLALKTKQYFDANGITDHVTQNDIIRYAHFWVEKIKK